MAFIDIKDPTKRDQIVKDYQETLKNLRIESENKKAIGLQRKIQLEKQYTPIIKATQESTNKITEELKKSRILKEKEQGYWDGDGSAVDYYLNLKTNTDKYYGIQKRDGGYRMGEKQVILDEHSNITVDGETFEASSGLWQLIMLATPTKYTDDDMEKYKNLLEATQVIFHPLTHKPKDKPKLTKKYKNILIHLESEYQDESGTGIQFLPGDINGLLNRFHLLAAERGAGNIKSTTNELVGILDELLRQNYLTREEYNAICKSLSC